MSELRAVLLQPDDDVAAVLDNVATDTAVTVVLGSSGKALRRLTVRQDIPFGHKVAVRKVAKDDPVRRYGFPIGIATQEISEGEHVHSHNMRSRLSPASKQNMQPPTLCSERWIHNLVQTSLLAAGACADAADAMAAAITEAHLRGVETHGLRRLRPYMTRIRSGGVNVDAIPQVSARRAVLCIDGCNGIGHHVATFAAKAVSDAAREHGIAIALVRNSNHFGFAGHYAALIAAKRQLAVVTSNGQVCVAPEGAKRALLSNNPLAIAAPLPDDDRFLELDLATSVTSRANIVEAARSGALLPHGWAQDCAGRPTRNPAAALSGSLLAFGNDKGFALLTALEAMTGVLCGGLFADQVSSKELAPEAPEGTAHTMIAIDLETALGADAYAHRLEELLTRLAALPLNPDAGDIRYPGERRWNLRRERLRKGIPLSQSDFSDAMALAGEAGVPVGDPR
jgi:LDH2 family malate/lactate/ureidoglycolate dehydrogenase